ncbi:hypothetical protein Hanom_Chr16g01426931 [Helianthus anomalus]
MQHLEMYNDTSVKTWEHGLSKECNDVGEVTYKHRKELDDLKHKDFTKILLHDENKVRPFVEADVARYKKLSGDEKKRPDVAAFEVIVARLDSK